jgi:hypothetical protein
VKPLGVEAEPSRAGDVLRLVVDEKAVLGP